MRICNIDMHPRKRTLTSMLMQAHQDTGAKPNAPQSRYGHCRASTLAVCHYLRHLCHYWTLRCTFWCLYDHTTQLLPAISLQWAILLRACSVLLRPAICMP